MAMLEELREQVTCSVCLDLLEMPKSLSCLHTFCMPCLQDVHRKSKLGTATTLTCPVCKVKTRLGARGLAGLKDNFLAKSILEMINQHRDKDNSAETQDKPETSNASSTATSHTPSPFQRAPGGQASSNGPTQHSQARSTSPIKKPVTPKASNKAQSKCDKSDFMESQTNGHGHIVDLSEISSETESSEESDVSENSNDSFVVTDSDEESTDSEFMPERAQTRGRLQRSRPGRPRAVSNDIESEADELGLDESSDEGGDMVTSRGRKRAAGVETKAQPQKILKTTPRRKTSRRAMNSYSFFVKENSARLAEKYPRLSFQQRSRLCGIEWKALDAQQKEKYNAMAARDKERAAAERHTNGRQPVRRKKKKGRKRKQKTTPRLKKLPVPQSKLKKYY